MLVALIIGFGRLVSLFWGEVFLNLAAGIPVGIVAGLVIGPSLGAAGGALAGMSV